MPFERMNLLFDSDSFVEIDEFVLHKCTYFGMGKKRILGDGGGNRLWNDRQSLSLFLFTRFHRIWRSARLGFCLMRIHFTYITVINITSSNSVLGMSSELGPLLSKCLHNIFSTLHFAIIKESFIHLFYRGTLNRYKAHL